MKDKSLQESDVEQIWCIKVLENWFTTIPSPLPESSGIQSGNIFCLMCSGLSYLPQISADTEGLCVCVACRIKEQHFD